MIKPPLNSYLSEKNNLLKQIHETMLFTLQILQLVTHLFIFQCENGSFFSNKIKLEHRLHWMLVQRQRVLNKNSEMIEQKHLFAKALKGFIEEKR